MQGQRKPMPRPRSSGMPVWLGRRGRLVLSWFLVFCVAFAWAALLGVDDADPNLDAARSGGWLSEPKASVILPWDSARAGAEEDPRGFVDVRQPGSALSFLRLEYGKTFVVIVFISLACVVLHVVVPVGGHAPPRRRFAISTYLGEDWLLHG